MKDPALRKAIERYAREHDIPAELLNDDAFVLVIVQDMARTSPTQSLLNALLNLEQQKIDILSAGKERAEQLRKDLDDAENLPPGKVDQVITDATRHMDHISDMINTLDERRAEVEQAGGTDIVSENTKPKEGTTNNDHSLQDMVIPGSNMRF